jgi:hypothetical protein
MALYNMTAVDEANGVLETLKALNELSNGLIGVFILTSLFLVLYIVLKKFESDTKEVLVVDSMLCIIAAVMMWALQIIAWNIIIYPVIALVASIIIHQFSD